MLCVIWGGRVWNCFFVIFFFSKHIRNVHSLPKSPCYITVNISNQIVFQKWRKKCVCGTEQHRAWKEIWNIFFFFLHQDKFISQLFLVSKSNQQAHWWRWSRSGKVLRAANDWTLCTFPACSINRGGCVAPNALAVRHMIEQWFSHFIFSILPIFALQCATDERRHNEVK